MLSRLLFASAATALAGSPVIAETTDVLAHARSVQASGHAVSSKDRVVTGLPIDRVSNGR